MSRTISRNSSSTLGSNASFTARGQRAPSAPVTKPCRSAIGKLVSRSSSRDRWALPPTCCPGQRRPWSHSVPHVTVPAAGFHAVRTKETVGYDRLRRELHEAGIEVRAGSAKGLIEEAPEAYKAVDQVVDVIAEAGITTKVARLRPIAIIKG